MTPIEAKQIIEIYRRNIKDLRPNSIVQHTNDLPFGKGKIKYAHFLYGETLVTQYIITKENATMLSESFGIIDSLFVEDPESINMKYREYIDGLKNGVITDFIMPNPFGECVQVLEYINFINECYFKNEKTDFFKNQDGPLATFVYDGVYKKAHKEKDLKLCIDLANSRLTRALPLLDQKSDKELVFI